MDILKLVGSASVVISALMVYLESQKYEKRRSEQINAYIALLEYIKKQIECFLLPIDSILDSCERGILKGCIGGDTDGVRDLDELLSVSSFCIDDDAVGHISAFVRDFGSYYRDGQIRSCELCIKELTDISKRMRVESDKNKKVILTLCICASFSIILMLI